MMYQILMHISHAAMLVAIFAICWGIQAEIAKGCSYRKIGGMAFVRVGPLSLSYCLTTKPIRKA